MDLEFDYFICWFKRGGLGSLVEYHVVLSTVERSVVNSWAERASDSASRANAAILFSARSAVSGSLARVMILLGPDILSFIYP